jgi:hypothetical protein
MQSGGLDTDQEATNELTDTQDTGRLVVLKAARTGAPIVLMVLLT